MEFDFYKVFLAESDYIIINAFRQSAPPEDQMSLFARQICKRSSGVGGIGLMFIYPDSEHSAALQYFSAQGEDIAPSSEALICAARYAFDFGLAQKEEIVLQTQKGPQSLQCIDSSHFSYRVGTPTYDGTQPLQADGTVDYQISASIGGQSFRCTPVHLRVPMAAVYLKENQKLAPEKITINEMDFLPIGYRVLSGEELQLQDPYPENTDCVEAAASAGVAAVVNGFCDRDAVILTHKQESFFFEWNERSNTVFVTGTPRYAFVGSFTFGEDEDGPAT